jgi:DNA-binding LacI/PurR family transcriptional regulator
VGHHSALAPINDRFQSLLAMAPRYSPKLEIRQAADADAFEGGRRATRELLRSGFRPTAIMCVNDFMAVGVLRELRQQGLRIPEDMSVTGFDNISLSEFCDPPLTTIHIPREAIGVMAFESLVGKTPEEALGGRELTVEPEFVVRGSTGPARAADSARTA